MDSRLDVLYRLAILTVPAGLAFVVFPSSITDLIGLSGLSFISAALLSIGLFINTNSVDGSAIGNSVASYIGRLLMAAGVKASVLAAVVFSVTNDPLLAMCAALITQIDPVASSLNDRTNSIPGVSDSTVVLLKNWAVMDGVAIITIVVGANAIISGASNIESSGFSQPILFFALSCLFCLVYFGASDGMRPRALRSTVMDIVAVTVSIALGQAFVAAVAGFMSRNHYPFEKFRIGQILLVLCGIVIGVASTLGAGYDVVDVISGLTIGVLSFTVQALVALLIYGALPVRDKVYLALAQQSGITATSSVLVIAIARADLLVVCFFAIVTINVLHALGRILFLRGIERRTA